MALFECLNRGNRLEASTEHAVLSNERKWYRRREIAGAAGALFLVATANSIELGGTAGETIGEAIEDVSVYGAIIDAAKDTSSYEMDAYEESKLLDEIAAEIEARRDPYQNEREIVILQNEPLVEKHREYIEAVAEEFYINVNHLVATGMVESCLNPDTSDSHEGAQGAFQVMPEHVDWFRELYGDGEYDPSNMQHSIRMGAAAYAKMLSIVDVDVSTLTNRQKLLVGGTAYNAGHTRANRLIAAGFDIAQLNISETEGHLAELLLIFDERVQNREGTTRCLPEDE